MTVLAWDEAGSRQYQTGIDRGVLFVPDGDAVPWNGLVSITETVDREIKSYYTDGVKYLDKHVPGSYEAKLSVYTYPDEFEDLLGISPFAPGVFLHDQRAKPFNLSYRTGLGNDLLGSDLGYRIHILYNVTASQGSSAIATLSASPAVSAIEFTLKGVPTNMWGIRPTSHISLDSTSIDPELLGDIEELLYGTEAADPALPDMVDLLALIETALA